MTDDIRWRAKKYLWKRLNRTEIALRKARMKKGAEREVQDLEYKMQVLKYLERLVQKEQKCADEVVEHYNNILAEGAKGILKYGGWAPLEGPVEECKYSPAELLAGIPALLKEEVQMND
jgi:hypothetical protein